MSKQSYEVEEYSFKSFSDPKGQTGVVENFQFEDLEGKSIGEIEKMQDVIRLERETAIKNDFKVSPIVEDHRGMTDQFEAEIEDRIKNEVDKRLIELKDQGFREGYEEGLTSGRQEVFEQTKLANEEKITTLTNMVSEVLRTQSTILDTQKEQLYNLVRNLSKWVILKELKDDGQYIHRLLEKLVMELDAKSNLLIQVDQKSFENMPDVLEHVQSRVGELPNVRVEVDYDIKGPGIVLEATNGIINGSMKEQFKSLDKLFETVGLPADTEVDFNDNEELNNTGESDSDD